MKKYILFILMLGGSIFLFSSQNHVSAISNRFLNTSAPPAGNVSGSDSSRVSLVVEKTDDVSVPSIALKWFIPATGYGASPSLTLEGFCQGGNARAWTEVNVYQNSGHPTGPGAWVPDGARYSNFSGVTGYTNACSGNNLILSAVPNSYFQPQYMDPPSTARNLYPAYRVLLVRVHIYSFANAAGNWNKFNAVVGGGLITQAEVGGLINDSTAAPPPGGAFAILGNVNNAYGYNASFRFSPSCDAFDGNNSGAVVLHWQDVDAGASYGNRSYWVLRESGPGGRGEIARTSPGSVQMGQPSNSHGFLRVPQMFVNRDYTWEWVNVNHVNTIHIWMPFSEAHYGRRDCGASNPIAVIDSCILSGGQTIVFGWGYDDNAGLNDGRPQVNLSVTGRPAQVVATDRSYRTTDINNLLNAQNYGTRARDGRYGFQAVYSGLTRGSTYSIAGTVINIGEGSNQTAGINTATGPPPNGVTGSFGFPGGRIPDGCLGAPVAPPTCIVSFIPTNPISRQNFISQVRIRNNHSANLSITGLTYRVTGSPSPVGTGLTGSTSASLPSSVAPTITSSPYPSREINITNSGSFSIAWTVVSNLGTFPCSGAVVAIAPPAPPECVPGTQSVDSGVNFLPSIRIINNNPASILYIPTATFVVRNAANTQVDSGSAAAPGSNTISGNGGVLVLTARSIDSVTLTQSGVYRAIWTIRTSAGAPTGSCVQTITILEKPYVRFYGNNVLAGGGLSDASGACVVNSTAAVRAYGSYGGATANHNTYRGSASELAIFAAAQIRGVLPGSQVNRPASAIAELAFANTATPAFPVTAATYQYGGGFGDVKCAAAIPDTTTGFTTTTSTSVNRNGRYLFNGNASINGGRLDTNRRFTLVVNGNLTIQENIRHGGSGGWATKEAIPLVSIYVTGDIYIDADVSRLDGIYVAGGNIHTCTNGDRLFNITGTTTEQRNFIERCSINRLFVYGSMTANNIFLLRTQSRVSASDIRESASNSAAAEVFQFSPEIYLALLAEAGEQLSDGSFDSLLTLPPAF